MRLIISLMLISVLSHFAMAEVYKCIDASGKVSYSNIPCPDGSNKKQVESLGNDTNVSYESYDEDIELEQEIEEFEAVIENDSPSVLQISNGERVLIESYIEYGKYTGFFFYAPWCPHCRKARPQLQASAKEHDNLVLREINIVDWKSDVNKQYKVPAIPYYKLYDPQGKLVSEGTSSSSDTYKYLLNPNLLK